jgi:putative transposase
MRKARWLVVNKNPVTAPALFHCISRVVDRKFVFGDDEREMFRMCMRMYENFSGCRVLSYCLMSNHFHILLEVPPMPVGGLSDDDLLQRLRCLYSEAFVAGVALELSEARKQIAESSGSDMLAQRIHERFTSRMHHLSEYMKGLLIRFTRWFNKKHSRTGTLWEERFKSVIVESGAAARTIAAYIDLNPVRAGMVADPADYRWSSYGEAIGGGRKGDGKKAREGLARAWKCNEGVGHDASLWPEVSKLHRRMMGMALDQKAGQAVIIKTGKIVTKNTAELLESADNETSLKDLGLARMLRCRVRYFTDGAVIGSRDFVNEAFEGARQRFGSKRKDGARKLRGAGAPAAEMLWSLRDLQKGNA